MERFFRLFLSFFLLTSSILLSQEKIFVPLEFKTAIEKGTRTSTGLSGENYWQNSSDYSIKVKVRPLIKKLEGEEKIIYYNNSPDTLNQIWMRLYQNIQKPTAQRDAEFNKESINDGMIITSLLVDDQNYNVENNNEVATSGTNLIIKLKSPLPPNSQIRLELRWNFEVAKNPWRMGFMDSTTAFIAYWYPQVSVYDDIDGWDKTVYSGYAEMYNDFNNYEVEITVPANYSVWATGLLSNPDEILKEDFLKKYNEVQASDTVINIITKDDFQNKEIFNSNNELTYNFKAVYVPDFAFAFSDHYLWDAASLKLENGNNVYIAAAYNENSKDFYDVTEIAKTTLKYFSEEWPGVPYPYPSAVVFNGSGGMEFPMIVNDGTTSSYANALGLTSHELFHQYMPFYLGTNERKYAWMDEGWAVMLPFDLQDRFNYPRRLWAVQNYESVAGTEEDIPPMVLSHHLIGTSYRNAAYNRPAVAYMVLRDFLGDELFGEALREFFNRWNGKHPLPYDFFNTFNDVTGKDLSWFWKPWLYEFNFPDLSIENVDSKNDEVFITVKNNGTIPLPIELNFIFDDGSSDRVYKPADIWSDGISEKIVNYKFTRKLMSITLGSSYIPDINKSNNSYSIQSNKIGN